MRPLGTYFELIFSAPQTRGVGLALAFSLLLTTRLIAQEPAPAAKLVPNGEPASAARLMTLRLPLEGDDSRLYQAVLLRAVDQLRESAPAGDRPLLVLQFAPRKNAPAPDGRGTLFEDAVKLARFLQGPEMAAVKTVAYLPQSIRGHAVLVALACDELAIAPDAELGEAGIDESPDRPVGPAVVSMYEQVASARGVVPKSVAASLVDARLEVVRVETEDSIQFVPRSEVERLKETRTVVAQDVLTPGGSMASFTGRQARELGFARFLAPSTAALARALGVPESGLEEDQSLLADWRPVVIDISGPITPRVARRTSSLIGGEIDDSGVNWIGLRIDSGGGDLESCLQLAASVAELARREVQTVAYVPVEATGEAALVALACDRLVMQPDATIGGSLAPVPAPAADNDGGVQRLPAPDRKVGGEVEEAVDENQDQPEADANPTREAINDAVASIRAAFDGVSDLPWSLPAAMIDPDLEVYRYSHRETGEIRLFCEEQALDQPDADAWRRGEAITTPGERFRLAADRAAELGVAWRVVDSFDGLKRMYGFADEVRVAEPTWADDLVEILASDQMAILLIMVGFVGVYIELNSPGLGIGGFIATVAFVLFFWSKFTAQTADWLEVMLFVTGVAFLLIEVFVLPGLGIFGLGGAGLVVASLILASQTFLLPKTESQMAELRGSIGVVVMSMAAFLVAAMVLRRYLPHSPLMRGMLLASPRGAELVELDHREAVADFTHLVGQTGKAMTNLLPSGRAEIDGELVDVVSDRESVDRGEAIVVVDAQGSRVVVRKA